MIWNLDGKLASTVGKRATQNFQSLLHKAMRRFRLLFATVVAIAVTFVGAKAVDAIGTSPLLRSRADTAHDTTNVTFSPSSSSLRGLATTTTTTTTTATTATKTTPEHPSTKGTTPTSVPPRVFLLGVQKGGSSSLMWMAITHPQLCAGQRKETHFFGGNYEKLVDA